MNQVYSIWVFNTMLTFWKRTSKLFIWLWDFMGGRIIWLKIRPPMDTKIRKRKPITFVIWCVGIYIACFGIASQRYENKVDIIENRANAIFNQLGTPIYKKALARIPRVQKLTCPVEPILLNPLTVLRSLFSAETVYTEIIVQLKETIEIWKDSLSYVDLREVDLGGVNLSEDWYRGVGRSDDDFPPANFFSSEKSEHGIFRFTRHVMLAANLKGINLESAKISRANLRKANLETANLTKADLTESNLSDANLNEADLTEADLSGANLINTDLSDSDLSGANLTKAYLNDANLKKAVLYGVNLSGVFGLSIEQLAKVETLYEAKLDLILMEEVKKKYPHLLEKPVWFDRKPKWWNEIPKK